MHFVYSNPYSKKSWDAVYNANKNRMQSFAFKQQNQILLVKHCGYLVVVEVVDEGGEAPGLVLQGQRQHGNMANEYGVKELRHFQVVARTQSLENNRAGLHAGRKSDLSF